MPIIRTGRGIVYFAHVPKCAGTAVEGYLTRRFGLRTRALLDSGHLSVPEPDRWCRSSPQHIEAQSLARMFNPGFFDYMFTALRHPAERLRSVYRHQRDIEGMIDPDEAFSTWLRALPGRRADDPWYLDNHARPMGDLVPEGSKAFRIEEGTDQIVNWLDEIMGNKGGPRAIAMAHSYNDRLARLGKAPSGGPVDITADDLAFIHALDPADFERFGYPVDPQDMTAGLPPLPAQAGPAEVGPAEVGPAQTGPGT